MKPLFAILVSIFCFQITKAQRIDSASIAGLPARKQEEVKLYLNQANNARTTAIILCMVGGSVAILGTVISITEDVNNDYMYSDDFNLNTGEQIVVIGAMVALTSIPFFIKIHNKRNEARAIIYGDKGAMLSPSMRIPGTGSVGLGLVIGLGR